MKVTLFTGAGASKAFGYPTTVEFMQEVDQRIKNSVPYGDVKTHLANKVQIDIEMVLWELKELNDELNSFAKQGSLKNWLFYSQNRFGSGNNNQSYKTEATKLMLDIQKLVYEKYWMAPERAPNNVYQKLLHSMGDSLAIFTTNYDLTIEQSFWTTGGNHNDDFSDGFDYDGIEVSWTSTNYAKARYKLYKLHGSLSWKKGGPDKIVRIPRSDWTRHEDHVMLYPGFKGKPEQEPFITLHKELSRSLSDADFCVVIGFSFRDEYINTLFKEASETNKKMKVIVWNPDAVIAPIPKERVIAFKKRFGEADTNEVLALLK